MKSVTMMKYLRVLKKVGSVLSAHRDFHTVATKLYNVVHSALDIKNFYIYLYNREKSAVNFEFYIEDGKEKRTRIRKFAHGFVEYVINEKRILKIDKDVRAFCKRLRIDPTRVPKLVKSWLGVPIMWRNTVQGVIAFQDNTKENAYSQYDEMLLSSIASQFSLFIENARLSDEVEELSLIDPSTKISSRRYFDLVVEREMKRVIAFSRQLSIAIIALDDFKKLAKQYGPQVINKLLVHVTRLIKTDIRDTDFVARYTRDKFILIFPETNNTGALIVSERIRIAVEKTRVSIRDLRKKRITVSIGIATYPYNAETLPELVQSADKALLQAQELGNSLVESM